MSRVALPALVLALGVVVPAPSSAAETPPASPAAAPAAPVVAYHNGRVSVAARGAARGEVIEALCRQADIDLYGDVLDARPVSRHFAGLSLPEALDRLLGQQNFLLVYDGEGRPSRVHLLGLPVQPPERAGRRPQPPRATPRAPARPAPAARRPAVRRPPARRPPARRPPQPTVADTHRLGLPRVTFGPRR